MPSFHALAIAACLQSRAEKQALNRVCIAQGGSTIRPTHAAQGTREFVRGSMASLPFTPGQSIRPPEVYMHAVCFGIIYIHDNASHQENELAHESVNIKEQS